MTAREEAAEAAAAPNGAPLDAALALVAAGVPCFPCGADKRPLIGGGFKSATADVAQVKAWWRRWPSALVAVPTGAPSGLWVADLDVDKDTGEALGETTVIALGIEPPPHVVRTRSGGQHWLYRHRDGLPRNTAKRVPGVDSRSGGGFIIAWHPDTLLAAVRDPDLAEPPAALLAALTRSKPQANGSAYTYRPGNAGPWAESALEREAAAVAHAVEGQRNHTLNRAAFALAQIVADGHLEHGRVEAELMAAASGCALAPYEAARTIASGMGAGQASPRGPRDDDGHKRSEQGAKGEPNGATTIDIYAGRADAIQRSGPVDEVCRRLGDRRLAFQYAGQASLVVKAASAVYRDPHDETKTATMLMVVAAVVDALLRPVEQVSTWQRYDERRKALVPKPVPEWVLRQIVAERGAGLPALLGVADHPVFHGGQLVAGDLGFHPATNLYIRCDPVPWHQWRDPIDAVRFLMDDWLGRFPFREVGDLERALLLPLTLLTRRTMIRGGAPAFFITSPEARSGKSLLARCLISAVTGVVPATVPFKTKPEEFAKTFDAAALEGQTTIFFNNAENGWRVGGGDLDGYIDSDEYSPRILGSSGKRTVPALSVIIACGNNIVAAGDTTTRVLEIRIERKRLETGLVTALDFTAANRPKILSALAEVLRYVVAPGTAETRFPAWERTVARPAMTLMGASSTLRTMAEAVSGSAANVDYEDFVLRLGALGDERERAALLAEDKERVRWLTASELIADQACNDALTRLLTRRGVAPLLRANNLPSQLEPYKDQAAAGLRLRICEMPEKAGQLGAKGQNRSFRHFTAEPTD